MTDFHNDYKRELTVAASALFAASPAEPSRQAGHRRRISLALLIAAGLLVLAAAAFAATQVIGVGAPVAVPRSSEHPAARTGVGVPVSGPKSRHGSARLLPVSVPDPVSGLPWGMRIVRTTRGLVCLQVGRLLGDRLGALGQDGRFNDDGLFHELPTAVLDTDTCGQPGDWVAYASTLTSAGMLPGPDRVCLAPGEPPTQSPAQPCPAADERLIAFGVLGPNALNVHFKNGTQARSIPTSGDAGAYLIVLHHPAESPGPVLGSSSGKLDHFPMETAGLVVSTIVFRFGARECQAGPERLAGSLPSCTDARARVPALPRIPRGLHSKVTLRTRASARGLVLDLAFRAPVAVHDAATAYAVQLTMPDTPRCHGGATSGRSIERDVRRGETVRVTEFVAPPRRCRGVVHGRIIFGGQPDPFAGPVREAATIGTFSFEIR